VSCLMGLRGPAAVSLLSRRPPEDFRTGAHQSSLQWEMRIPGRARQRIPRVGTEGERVSASENRRMQRMADDGTQAN
jgi:hypothetical protein